ncbi:DNA segregation ATPase FtsK/SpoIIIE, S-DNA-T family [Prauserella aidingensis]|uniref:FtsK/SpoIIIE domain-containing protein n=1 Tax=Prauserella aidingensis TaxID=387890 RepID=UPI0020A4036D|nr:FtsK/SpoIIIE domain-containing protein [Prauserella aidingensis]MCP2255689.1 DNA segregation ATPase FtsK/SpoIIIE, S-DNA-T family [Prauserella aidingensis]
MPVTIDKNAGWQEIEVHPRRHRPDGVWGSLAAALVWLARGVAFVATVIVTFVAFNWLPMAALLPAVWTWAVGLDVVAAVQVVVAACVLVAWLLVWPSSFDVWVASPWRMWMRRRRYFWKWADVMVASGLTAKKRSKKLVAPKVVFIRHGRFADVLTVRLPAGITRARLAEHLDELVEAMHAREARVVDPPRWSWTCWVKARLAGEFQRTDKPGLVFVRLAFGDPLVHVQAPAPAGSDVDLAAVPIGTRDDGGRWLVNLLGTHTLLAGATGSGKGSVLWSILAGIGPAIRGGLVQVVGLDPKGGMELGFGRELFRQLVTMDGTEAEEEAVSFLEGLADEADRRASLLAGYARTLEPSRSMPFILVVIDELASVTAFISDSKRQKRAEAALGRLLTKGRAPGMHVIGALQDPRKEVVRWRDLFPTRIGLRLVEASQPDMVLGDGARDRGARCEEIADTSPGVGYVVEDGSRTVTRVRAGYLTDDDIRQLAQTYRPGPVLHSIDGGVA